MPDYLCNLIIPGAAKSGTSSLHEYLAAHPQIEMSSNKEPHHFCRDASYAGGPKTHNKLFRHKQGVVYYGESSTGYLPWSPSISRIKKDLREPKIIILLRHPVERCFSHYRWRFRLGLEKRPFLEAIKADGFGYDPEKPDKSGYMAYLEFSKYSRHCPAWIQAFGKENCLLLNSEDLRSDHAGTMARCFSFLGVSAIEVSKSIEENSTESLSVRPPTAITRIARLLPSELKNAEAYLALRRSFLKPLTPKPPLKMTAAEFSFVSGALADDINWFEKHVVIDSATV